MLLYSRRAGESWRNQAEQWNGAQIRSKRKHKSYQSNLFVIVTSMESVVIREQKDSLHLVLHPATGPGSGSMVPHCEQGVDPAYIT